MPYIKKSGLALRLKVDGVFQHALIYKPAFKSISSATILNNVNGLDLLKCKCHAEMRAIASLWKVITLVSDTQAFLKKRYHYRQAGFASSSSVQSILIH